MKLYKDSLWHRVKFTLLSPSEWGFKYETTAHCKCKQIKALAIMVSFVDLNCFRQTMNKLITVFLGSTYGANSANKNKSSESLGGIKLEFEE